MGKKTDAYIKELDKLIFDCMKPMSAVIQAKARLADMTKEVKVIEAAHNKRCNEIDPTGSTQHEAEIASDPQIKKLDKQLDVMNDQFTELFSAKQSVKDSLKTVAIKFKTKLGEFETYITKKEKSLNPFRGKKSVPAAKKYIKDANAFLDAIRSALAL